MQTVAQERTAHGPRQRERGAALITTVLISTLLLAAGGALVLVTSSSVSNAADATSEAQAYYAAEAGVQQVLGALRGHRAPNPVFNATASHADNLISFRKAVKRSTSNVAGDPSSAPVRLSRWLPYNYTPSGGAYADRVTLTSNYAPLSGMAYGVESITDPDFTDVLSFTAAGAFDNGTSERMCAVNRGCGDTSFGAGESNNGARFTLIYAAPTTTMPLLTNGETVTASLGSFTISVANGSITLNNAPVPVTITVNQTKPWPMSVPIRGVTASGTIERISGNGTGTLTLSFPRQHFNLGGVSYDLAATTLAVQGSGAVATLNAQVTPAEPSRLLLKVRGYGPRGASKKMQVLVSRSLFDFKATSAITIRSHSDNMTAMQLFNPGNSSQYVYDGNDNAGGPSLPAYSVTHNVDRTLIAAHFLTGNQAQGTAPVQVVPVADLSDFLQTTGGVRGARQALENLRVSARNQMTPGCTPAGPGCDRYFGSGESVSNFGLTEPNGLLTFVDGDVDLPPGGGRGMLVVTGTLTLHGSSDFKGLVLVLGRGKVVRQGGGGDTSLGAIAVARFDSTGDFLNPYFDSNGGGNSAIRFDSEWVRRGLGTTGPVVLGVSEY